MQSNSHKRSPALAAYAHCTQLQVFGQQNGNLCPYEIYVIAAGLIAWILASLSSHCLSLLTGLAP